jgi:hypothetical protein
MRVTRVRRIIPWTCLFDSTDTYLFQEGENVLLDALQALQNEGTRAEVANTFKGQGNEAVQELKWIDAKEFYTKAIAVINAKVDKWEKPEDPEEEAALLRKLDEASHINRALCNLELGMPYLPGCTGLSDLFPLQETTVLVLSTVLLPLSSTLKT